MIEPQGLVVRISVQSLLDELELQFHKLPPGLLVCVAFFQEPGNQFTAIVPGGKVGEVGLDHFGRVFELSLYHAGISAIFVGYLLQRSDDKSSIVPAVEVPVIAAQHLPYQAKLLLPKPSCISGGQQIDGLLQQPYSVVPYPVTFWKLHEERDEEVEVVCDIVKGSLLSGGQALILLHRRCGSSLEYVLQDQTTVVPYGVVLGILGEELRGKGKGFSSVLPFCYLSMCLLATTRAATRYMALALAFTWATKPLYFAICSSSFCFCCSERSAADWEARGMPCCFGQDAAHGKRTGTTHAGHGDDAAARMAGDVRRAAAFVAASRHRRPRTVHRRVVAPPATTLLRTRLPSLSTPSSRPNNPLSQDH